MQNEVPRGQPGRFEPAFHDFRAALTFLTRLPVGAPAGSAPSGSAFLRYSPMVGVVVAGLAATVMGLGVAAGLPSTATALLAIGAMIWTTGALHEDGLADVADGFGGGSDRQRKLAIMRDSRIGTFGACALGCSLILRTACLASLLDRGFDAAASALVIAAATSRALMLVAMTALPPARPDGLARTAGALPISSLAAALLMAGAVTVIVALSGACPIVRLLSADVAALGTCALGVALARRQIGGVTGDVIGAVQQTVEIAVLVVLSAGVAAA